MSFVFRQICNDVRLATFSTESVIHGARPQLATFCIAEKEQAFCRQRTVKQVTDLPVTP